MTSIPCFLCGQKLDKRLDRHGKPYFVCNYPCGAQIFIRRQGGIENLSELVRTLKKRDLPLRHHARVLFEIQAVLAEIRGVKKELKSLDSIFNLFANDKDEKRARKLLRARIDNLLAQLEKIADS
jgi:hypothetical protein